MKTLADVVKHLHALERKHPSGGSDSGIPLTEEAQTLLEPYYIELMKHTAPLTSGVITLLPGEVFAKCLGDSMAVTEEDGFCGCNEGVIGIRVAERVIDQLKTVWGISI